MLGLHCGTAARHDATCSTICNCKTFLPLSAVASSSGVKARLSVSRVDKRRVRARVTRS